jgi:imidazolonepropionase-like amidohydrolase
MSAARRPHLAALSGAVAGLALATLASRDARAADAAPPPVAIVHARVMLPGGRAPLEDATLVLAQGKIAAVGRDVRPPPGAATVDARGKVVTPGLIDADSSLGVVDVPQEGETDDTDVRGPITPALRMVDGYNARSAVVPVTRRGGVTSVVVAPHSGVLAGQGAFVDLAGDTLDEAVARPVIAQYARVDEDTTQGAAGTRGAVWLWLRDVLGDARFYGAHRAAYDANASRALSTSRAGLESLQPVLRGEEPLVIAVHRASDIEAALRFCDEQKVKPILEGASEAWMVADELARRRVPVIVDPLEDLPVRFDRLHARSDNAALLSRAGVPVILATFSSHQGRLLWQRAGNAVRLGMDHDAALRAVTETPAEAFGMKGYGRLEPGAIANVVVWSGDPLETGTHVERVFVRGREEPLETRQTLLLRRYRTLPVLRDGTR